VRWLDTALPFQRPDAQDHSLTPPQLPLQFAAFGYGSKLPNRSNISGIGVIGGQKHLGVAPLEDPNAGWIIEALEAAFQKFGAPKHLISDHGSVFTSGAFAELLTRWNVKQRFGVVGKYGSIAVTERVIKTLKYEWLKRVALIKDFEHLQTLCESFVIWYNEFRPHTRLSGATPQTSFSKAEWEQPAKDAKIIPFPIERVRFRDTRTVAFWVKQAA
jgi:hypothetical protein